MKKYFWFLVFLFIISRFCFLANYPHFYDSPEYLRESLSPNFFISLRSSHEVVHPVWLFFTQIFQRIISQPTSWELSLIAALFGLISTIVFYLLIKRNFHQRVALFSLVPLIFFPHLWLIQTNVLHESLDAGLFLVSLLFFDFFLERKKFYWLVLTVIFLSLAIFDFVGILLWSPVFIGLAILRSKKINWSNITWSLGVIFISFVFAVWSLYFLEARLKVLLFDYGGRGILSGWSSLNILRMLRNDILILFYGYSLSAILVLIISVAYFFKKKNWPVLIFFLSFFLPFLITGKFWYGGLFGRYSALIAYPLALLLGIMPWRKIYWILIVIIILTFLPTFWAYQKTPIPKIQASLIDKIGLKEKDILVLSDYQRPQLDYYQALYIHGDEEIEKRVEEKITKNLLNGGRVFISQQALTFPYWQYDGQQIHIISKGNKIPLFYKGKTDKSQLKEFLKDRDLKIVAEDKNYPQLTIYQLE